MATRRRNPAAPSPVQAADPNTPPADIDLAVIRNGRATVVKSQTIQLVKYHPITVVVGIESDLPADVHPTDTQPLLQALADECDYRLAQELRSALQSGLEVLDEMGRRPVI